MTSKIILENIKIHAFHGVLKEETILGTTYIINAELHADLEKASQSDNLADTINYAEVNETIHQEMRIPSRLLEHVIGRMINKLAVQFPQLTYVKIKLTKTRPPMHGEMSGVSIEIDKQL